MTRRVSKHGTTYTEGSQATPEPGFPTVCTDCGRRIVTSREEFQHHTDDRTGERWARHLPVGVCKAAG